MTVISEKEGGGIRLCKMAGIKRKCALCERHLNSREKGEGGLHWNGLRRGRETQEIPASWVQGEGGRNANWKKGEKPAKGGGGNRERGKKNVSSWGGKRGFSIKFSSGLPGLKRN